jgi:hypothetical protein
MNRRTLFKALPLAAALMVAGLSACQSAVAASDAGLVPSPTVDAPKTAASKDQIAVLAGGCFWGMESVFEHVKGVHKVEAGYSGGAAATAHYDDVSDGDTGHAESIRVEFDPSQISYGQLLQVYFSVPVDPTQLNAVPLRHFLQQPRAAENRRQLYRPADRGQDLPRADRDAGGTAEGVLSGRGVSPELRAAASGQSVHRL